MKTKIEREAELMGFAVMKHLGPAALTGGRMSIIEAFELGWKARAALAPVAAEPVQPIDQWQKTSAELNAVTYEMDAIYVRYPGKDNMDEREVLLKPLRLRCLEIGERRQALVTPIAQPAQGRQS